ncbi:RINT1-like protein MAG2 [Camellia sinensis]|uniref:RINT1-like protein MAG2 n=1 Tax=Camellia sinensis TaxID=4442 RepID=UPI0010367F63|nr:RINT1-like protein MAG2 [Camellia sinensis]
MLIITCSSSLMQDPWWILGEKWILKDSLEGGERWLKENGIRHLTVNEEEKIKLVSLVRNLRKHSSTQNSEDVHLLAIKSLKLTEDVLASVTKTRPQWARLLSAVDHRVDRALAILRPQAIADHRALLTSLGWPPPLSMLNSSDSDARKPAEVQNPLFTMQGDLKHQYCENFVALCSLQELQRQRKSRQLAGHNREVALHQPLWSIEELVNPLAIEALIICG